MYLINFSDEIHIISDDEECDNDWSVPLLFAEPYRDLEPKKPGWRGQLQDLLIYYEVRNEKHYQRMLTTNKQLCLIIQHVAPTQTETIKKNIFQMNRQTVPMKEYGDPYEHKDYSKVLEDQSIVEGLAVALQFIKSVAAENNETIEEMMGEIYSILKSQTGKRNTVVFLGASDSGKTTFANLLTSGYFPWEIGNFKTPVKSATSTFWLESLPGTDIYRCEEFCLSDYDTAQIMKSLFEGNPNLEADIKYKSPITVPKRPLIVTMNGHHKRDITRHISSEYFAFENRSKIIVMNESLQSRTFNGRINSLVKNSVVISGLLFNK